ncbi:MAG: YidC/Oxa1 family membrane protein insertase [Actinobacteria bacterium]|nr:YidC/Oxa1 family membrane protein insertase [Actinomycetota bacterium]
MAEIWKGLLDLLQTSLQFFQGFVSGLGLSSGLSYGIAIVLLTVAVRLLMLPLTIKQTTSMMDMQRLQPKLKELQEKYKDDKDKLQQEMMKLYQEHKVNPFGGCLPLLLQLPVFFALFRVLYQFDALKKAVAFGMVLGKAPGMAFAGGIAKGLVIGWPYLLLIALMAVTSYIPSKMMMNDPQQEKTMLFMSAFMVFIAWSLPAGVLIYWVTTNLISIVQQWIMLKLVKKEEPASAPVAKGGKKKSKQAEAE